MVKQGIVSHGYQLNGELDLYNSWWVAHRLGAVYARGELAGVGLCYAGSS